MFGWRIQPDSASHNSIFLSRKISPATSQPANQQYFPLTRNQPVIQPVSQPNKALIPAAVTSDHTRFSLCSEMSVRGPHGSHDPASARGPPPPEKSTRSTFRAFSLGPRRPTCPLSPRHRRRTWPTTTSTRDHPIRLDKRARPHPRGDPLPFPIKQGIVAACSELR